MFTIFKMFANLMRRSQHRRCFNSHSLTTNGAYPFHRLLVIYISSSCPLHIFILCYLSFLFHNHVVRCPSILNTNSAIWIISYCLFFGFMLSCHVDIFNIYIVKFAIFSFMNYGFTVLLGRVPPNLMLHAFYIFF